MNSAVQSVQRSGTGDDLPVIESYTIENNRGTRLVVSNYGAAVVSLVVKNGLGSYVDVVLGYGDLREYLDDEYYLGTVVGRYANRIAGGRVFIDNEPFSLSVRSGGYHQHGGLIGFNKKFFTAFPFRSASGNGITFRYVSPDLEEGFPGEFSLDVTYILNELDEWIVEYKGISSKTTLVNLTQHVYFNLCGDPSRGLAGHEFRILSDQYLPVNQQQVPTGQLAEVKNTPFDFTGFRSIDGSEPGDHEQLALSNGYDHSFVLEAVHSAALKHAAVVREPACGIQLDVFTTEPSVHFYTGNFLDNVKGKNEVIYNKRAGFCLETQHFPDSPNHPHFPSTVLEAGQEFYSKTVYRISVL